MTRTASAHGLTPEPARAWLENAPCKAEPDAMFPGDLARDIEHAKSFCRTCPAVAPCLRWALDTNQQHGVWGGLSEAERRNLRRAATRRRRPRVTTPRPAPTPTLPDTLEELWAQRTRPLDGGHLGWQGYEPIKWRGTNLTPRQIGFTVDRGRPPVGRVLRLCDVTDCVLPAHFADNEERMQCGTRGGYRKHQREGTEICGPCRAANTDADNLLRRTGTTKAAA